MKGRITIISPLYTKIRAIRERKAGLKREYDAKIAELDAEERRIQDAIGVVNNAIKDIICPTCNGTGETRLCDAAGDMESETCPDCGGTGIAGR